MSDGSRRTLWVALLAGVFAFAALSSFFGLFFNQDFLYFANFNVLVWAGTRVTAPEHSPRRELAVMANLAAITIFAGRAEALGVFPRSENWLRLHETWISAALLGANYLAHVWLRVQAYRAAPPERRHPIRRLLVTVGLVPVLLALVVLLGGDFPYTSLVEQRMVSPTLMYEKWVVDVGGTGGIDCVVYRIRTLGLIGLYQRIDPDHGDPSPLSGGCGQ